MFLNINDVNHVKHDLKQWGRPEDIDYIVVTGKQNYPTKTTVEAANTRQTAKKSWASVIKDAVVFSSPSPSWY